MFSSKKDFVEQKTKHLLTRSGILNFCAVAMSLHDLGYRPLVSDCLSFCSFSHLLTLGSLTYCECLSVVEIRRSHLLIFGSYNL